MENIVDLIGDAIEGLTTTIPIDSVTDNADGTYTILVSKTKWIRPKSQKSLATKVTINSIEYDVDSMVYNTSITVTSAVDLTVYDELSVAAPVYINGTQLAVNHKRKAAQFSWLQCPFTWLVEPFISNETADRMKIVEALPDLTILFLDNQNSNDWTTEQHYEKVITPMRELAEAFQQKLRDTWAVFGKITRWQTIIHVKFGKEAEYGHISSIIDEKTSGVEVRFSVEILKNCDC